MFDLDPGIDLDEIELELAVDQELDGAGVGVAGGLDKSDCGLADVLADRVGQVRRWSFLDKLLVPSLQAAVSFPEMHCVSVLIGEDLHLDVPRILDVLFQIDTGIVEGFFGFSGG